MSDRKKEKVLPEKVLYSNPLYPKISHSKYTLKYLFILVANHDRLVFIIRIYFVYRVNLFQKKLKLSTTTHSQKIAAKNVVIGAKSTSLPKRRFWFPLPLPTCHTLLFFLQRHSLHVIPLKVTKYGIKNNNFFYSNITYEGSYNIIHKIIN